MHRFGGAQPSTTVYSTHTDKPNKYFSTSNLRGKRSVNQSFSIVTGNPPSFTAVGFGRHVTIVTLINQARRGCSTIAGVKQLHSTSSLHDGIYYTDCYRMELQDDGNRSWRHIKTFITSAPSCIPINPSKLSGYAVSRTGSSDTSLMRIIGIE